MSEPCSVERFESVRRLTAIAYSSHPANVTLANRRDQDLALKRYVEAVDAIVVELAALEHAGVLVDIAAMLRARQDDRSKD